MNKLLLTILSLSFTAVVTAQNTCATAVTISAGTHVVDQINGTQVPAPICTLNGPGASAGEWFIYTPTEEHSVTITTDLPSNNGTDTRFHIYTGGCDNLVCFAGDDDSGNGFTSMEVFNVTPGTTYYIAFDNRWTSAGFTFALTESDVIVPVPGAVTFTQQFLNVEGYTGCIVDMDGDHLDDVVGVSSTSVNIHYQAANTTGFTSVVVPTPQANYMPSWSIAAGDIDKNGKTDLLYGAGSGVTFMKQNETGTGFTEISGSQNIFSQRSNFVDLNLDGDLDAFVCHDVAPNVYYINDGNGNLTYNQGGMGDFPTGGNYGSIFIDYDNDGDSDLFIAKCRGGNSGANIDELHRNNGNGTFTNVSIASNMAEISQSWSSAWADFDNDGDMDAMIGASSTTNGGHKLRRNNGDGTFTDVTVGSGYDTFTPTNIEHVAHDFNNDGFVDVFGGGNIIMINNGNMTFSPSEIDASNGPIGDLNNDGFLDIQNGNTIYLNTPNENNWLKVLLQGIESNGNGIGARVEVHGAFGIKIRDVRSGDGFEYMSSLNTHFGLGEATEITQLVVKWPSGIVDVINNPDVNQAVLVVEGASLGTTDLSMNGISIYPNPANEYINISVSSGTAITKANIYDLTGKVVLSSSLSEQRVFIQNLSAGTYLLVLTDNEGKQHSQKFIKK
jgi:hypothetical protein